MLHYKVLGWAIALAALVTVILLFSRGGRGCLAWVFGIAGLLALIAGFAYALLHFVR